ncbi:MAG: hypothetical protein ED557_02520 [Balneola sp.]|nr:MAG: hypothetical protein ED557_02520 [Balneola sp.]
MKRVLLITSILLLSICFTYGQSNNIDLENLVKIGEIYSSNVNASGEELSESLESLRGPELDKLINTLIAVGSADENLLTKEFLSKPSFKELKYWYVLREIHYNNLSEDPEKRSSIQVAEQTLEEDLDSRWLLSNYYYRIRGGIAKLFNENDLRNYNIELDTYGLQSETEKAILFFEIVEALTGRFQVLQMMNNHDKVLEFADKLPSFNGKPYYEYTSFSFADFEWIGYEKIESYKERHLGDLYSSINSHFTALYTKEKDEDFRNLYFNSILFIPDYFKYSGSMENDLQVLYNQSRN